MYYYSELGITEKIAKLAIENFQTINTDVQYDIKVFEEKYQTISSTFQTMLAPTVNVEQDEVGSKTK